ncbi:hypothetical protein L3X38_002112 [Prunus dulcis]|uniref:Uncharacterized protein n=1 Tax=Prunus dulcis TaxID=3755 RepID=A0AAD4ZKG2_PRUDU|nr:hypothetical protein L3X38_002112 [Prunus dulcis]
MRAELVAELDTARYTNKPLPGTGFESRGGEVRALKNGLHLSVDFERNRLRAAALLVRLCISFTVEGDFISRMALIWRGCASIPHCVTKYPRNRPDDTPNVHLLGFSFMRYWQSRLNASARFLRW